MSRKARLSVTVDEDVLRAAEQEVAANPDTNLSAWVTEAIRLRLDHTRRLAALAAFIADYEAREGVITEADMAAAAREVRRRSVSVRGKRAGERRGKYGR